MMRLQISFETLEAKVIVLLVGTYFVVLLLDGFEHQRNYKHAGIMSTSLTGLTKLPGANKLV
jgi:hypothetical protein